MALWYKGIMSACHAEDRGSISPRSRQIIPHQFNWIEPAPSKRTVQVQPLDEVPILKKGVTSMIGIQKITNLLNGKVQIGQSSNIEKRWISHKSHAFNTNAVDYNKPLYRAIRKYGINNFSFEVIENCALSDLNKLEIFQIKEFEATNPNKGYNLTQGGSHSAPLKLNYTQIQEIIKLLQSSDLTQQEIADKFNVSQRTISGINTGEAWLQEELQYPIRTYFKKYYCKDCGKEVYKGSIRCSKCAGIFNRQDTPMTREELKKMIRTMSFVQIGKKYHCADNNIRKYCDKLNLPRTKKEINSQSDEEWEKI